MTFGRTLRPLWLLDPEITFLNHGSFGATPRPVLDAQLHWRHRMEQQPVRFFSQELRPALRETASQLGEFIGARGEDLAFVDNATTAVNAVVGSLSLEAGDELVMTSHGYGAVRNTLRHHCRRSGAQLIEAEIPFPPQDVDSVVLALEQVLSPRTRLVVLDHITSPTALILPVKPMIERCRQHRIPVLIDGAHALGMIPLQIEALGADWYTGNAHKWLCAPKGCAFLWTHPHRQAHTYPTVVSHGLDGDYDERFDWTGTRDPSAWLALTAALDLHRTWGAEQIRTYMQTLVRWGAKQLLPVINLPHLPVSEPWLGAMISLPLDEMAITFPSGLSLEEQARHLHDQLGSDYRIEVPIIPFHDRLWIRISAQVYLDQDDFCQLVRALEQLSQNPIRSNNYR